MISDKIAKLANIGIDISGLHELEFEFYIVGRAKVKDLESEFYHPDNSMRVKTKKHRDGHGYSLKLRVDSYISQKSIGHLLSWLNNVANKHNATLENWRVVQ